MKKLLVAMFVLCAALKATAQDKALLDKARTEGKASFYANITAVEPIMKAFTADTGVKAEYTRISTSKFVATTITEFEAGKLHGRRGAGAAAGAGDCSRRRACSPPTARRPPRATRSGRRKDDRIMLFGIEYVAPDLQQGAGQAGRRAQALRGPDAAQVEGQDRHGQPGQPRRRPSPG